MGVFSPAGSSQAAISASDLTITSGTNVTVSIPVANTEQSYDIPAGTKKVVFKLRSNGTLKTAFVSGDTNTTNYWTSCPGADLPLDLFKLTTDLTIYFQSSKIDTLEILLLS